MDTARKLVVDCLLKVESSGFSNLVLLSEIDNHSLTNQDKAFATKLFYGTVERKLTLNYILQKQLSKPIAKMDKEIVAILQSGLYQLLYMQSVPAYAAINQAVGLCPVFKKTSAKGLVNAVLRKCQKFDIDKETFKDKLTELSVKYSVNTDIVKIILRDYPDSAEDILKGMFITPKFTVKINTTKISAQDFKKLIADSGLTYNQMPLDDGIEIIHKGSVTDIPGFKEGYFYVQGITSQYAVRAAGIQKDNDVLDLCAAPGGKSFAAAIELGGSGSVTSCDPNASRLKLIQDGAKRLGLSNITTVQNSGEIYNDKLKKYDVIICDVPCSGIGIIPKKPDLRYKSMTEVDNLAQLQYDILTTASKYLKANGTIVYSTCTINRQENEQVVDRFLKENINFKLEKQHCPVENVINSDEKVTFLSHLTGFDGFFVAVLRKM
ncbi:MAG: 16S rRNA (cytosine(967)-C(5))-methyltransferase RsmB [Oscillospiraceae bacterium]|nr:16S rRNA (cytosine(967)-C(5))-methyltransferase RsmB [Oscillospiraceae bacterium]MBQ5313663.1 16S rRNA (cytosine(967)-C(5))-methyltransferase RsmB [Oscillospiraceae bacterium]